jgi:hypothetical protein
MARIAIVALPAGVHQVNLTDSRQAWERQLYTDPRAALAAVVAFQERGHKVALPSALTALRTLAHATQETTP